MANVKVPLFSEAELAAAFALLAPPEEASQYAKEWFRDTEDLLDQDGRFLYPGGWGEMVPLAEEEQPADSLSAITGPERDIETDERLFANVDPSELPGLLLRLGDLHLALVALLDDERFEWMRRVRRMSRPVATRNRVQLSRAVAAWRRRWLTPDGQDWLHGW